MWPRMSHYLAFVGILLCLFTHPRYAPAGKYSNEINLSIHFLYHNICIEIHFTLVTAEIFVFLHSLAFLWLLSYCKIPLTTRLLHTLCHVHILSIQLKLAWIHHKKEKLSTVSSLVTEWIILIPGENKTLKIRERTRST